MKKFKIKIMDMIFDDNLSIFDENNIVYKSKIKKGSISCRIYNENGDEVSLGELNINDVIIIYGENVDKNNIEIKKIIVKNSYILYSESSDEIILNI
jgi:hypothetical protein